MFPWIRHSDGTEVGWSVCSCKLEGRALSLKRMSGATKLSMKIINHVYCLVEVSFKSGSLSQIEEAGGGHHGDDGALRICCFWLPV